ncbi:MATE efflux family protein [Ceratobasidium sp. AG-Ba]|nr:MATE efflux family protein [Ceratobasidium sp. AG-Ba]QRW10878.1 MATE efflux family protein [Ceratobasidium sp. AG-Ba]
MSLATDTPVSTRSRSGSTSTSGCSYETATVVVSQSRNDSMYKIPPLDDLTADERTPLLVGGDRVMRGRGWTYSLLLKEAWVLVRYALPVACTMLLEYSFLATPVVAIGHLSTEMLAGAALGETTAGVTGFSILQGFVSALDSVLPQAWTSDNPSHVGLWAQRMSVMVAFLTIPIINIWMNAECMFLYLRQDPTVAQYAALYLKYLTITLPSYSFNRIIRRYFQAQGLMGVPSFITAIVTPINIAITYALVWGPECVRLGFIGAPIASSISMTFMSCLYIAYGIFFVPRTAWHPISSRAFTDMPKIFRLGLSGVGQTAAEWWSWEFISLAASQLGPTTLASQSVLVVSASSAYMVHAGLGLASAVRIGNLLGAGDAYGALIASKAALVLALIQSLILASVFMSMHSQLAYFFNSDQGVAKLVSGVVPLLAIYQVVDGIAGTASGILRACGKISTSASANFVGYYILGIPLGVFLAFMHRLGLFGLWIGLTTALFFVVAILYAAIVRLDWDVEVREAKERVETRPSNVEYA